MKRTILISSGLITVILFVLNTVGTYRLCGGIEYGQCMDTAYAVIIAFFPIIPLFIFSAITYRMRETTYRAWIRFAAVWIPLSMVAVFLAPEYSADWMYPIVKSTVAFFSSLLFAIISTGILFISWFRRLPR